MGREDCRGDQSCWECFEDLREILLLMEGRAGWEMDERMLLRLYERTISFGRGGKLYIVQLIEAELNNSGSYSNRYGVNTYHDSSVVLSFTSSHLVCHPQHLHLHTTPP